MKLSKDGKIAVILGSIFALFVGVYLVVGFYSGYTGKLETEFIISYSEYDSLKVNGFAVRDEGSVAEKNNGAVLYKQEGLVYVPVIDDGENVSKNGVLALAFSSEAQADAYLQQQELKQSLEAIEDFKSSDDLSYGNILFLNSQTGAHVSDYISLISSGNVSEIDYYSETVADDITTRQIAVGEELDYDKIISDYNKQIKALGKSYKIAKTITSPIAGYFVGSVDGYENACSYKAVEDNEISVGECQRLLGAETESFDGAYGKIIAQHNWYYIFDVKISDASVLKTGYWVNVSFPEIGVTDLDMKVYSISEAENDIVTVTLKCTAMNENLSKIRKETANIILNKHTGYKISNDALRENEDGVQGVYAIVGNIIRFSPVEILFYGDDYVIAKGVKALRNPENEKEGYYHLLKQYDRIIVKGINLEDGSIVS